MAKLSAHGKVRYTLDRTEIEGKVSYYKHLAVMEDGAVLRKTGWSDLSFHDGRIQWSGYKLFVHAKSNTPEYLRDHFAARGYTITEEVK